ncbi:MAG: hypothetical protein JWP50_2807, partial [Phenylobacterium sp.]|nr:hypothetical protein [Phenylobacterium sp.]
MAVKAPSDEVQRVICLALDAAFYRTVYEDIGEAGDALRHYAFEGWREGRDPAPWFSARRYLAANPDIAKAGWEPLHHYLTRGRFEGRDVYPSDHAHGYFARRLQRGEAASWSAEALIAPLPAQAPVPAPAPVAPAGDPAAEDRALVAKAFDAAFYLGTNPDIGAAGVDPLAHFLVTGWREGRDPSPRFSVRDYLETYPDIAQAGINPFVHYLRTGRIEGRAPRHDLGFRYEILATLVPIEERVARAAAASAGVKRGAASALAQALAVSRTGLKDLHITLSHDDYTANLGGVQLCLQREAARIAGLGRDHLHIHPAAAWPVVRTRGEPGVLGVVWNGEPVGFYSAATL